MKKQITVVLTIESDWDRATEEETVKGELLYGVGANAEIVSYKEEVIDESVSV